jgi:hypothetical protein
MKWQVYIYLICFVHGCVSIQHIMSGVALSYNASDVKIMDTWVGKNLTLIQLYDNFCGLWIWEYPLPMWDVVGGVPMISFQPEQPNCVSTPSGIAGLIASGQYDTYLDSFIAKTKTFLSGPNGVYGDGDDRRLYMRFAHEMNGNWYPWSGNTTSYVLMWRHVWNLFAKAGITNTRMQWVWCVNWQDQPANLKAEDYYPGDDYVDWLSIDGYNLAKSESWSHWMEPAEVFSDMIKRFSILSPNKPIGVAEVGCSTSGATTAMKNQWISDLYQYALQTNIRFLMWFNIESDYTDFSVFGSRNGSDTYTSPISHVSYLVYDNYVTKVAQTALPLDPINIRILTDDQFAGNFS